MHFINDVTNKMKKYLVISLLALWAIVQVYPLVWLLLFSLKDNSEIFGGNIAGLPTKFLWQNYSKALLDAKVGLYFFNSVLVTGITIIATDILALAASYALARMKWKLRKITMVVFLMGLMIPIHAALLPNFIFLRHLGLINTYLALILPYVAFAIPISIIILTSFMQSIPKEMEEAACIDGCSIYGIFIRIIIPLVKPAIATVSIFTFLSSWNELMFAVIFINKQQLKTLTVGIMSMAGQFTTDWGPIGAGLVVATLPTLFIYIVLSDQVQKSLITGAVKG